MRPCPISSLLLVVPLLFSSTFAPASADVLSLDDAIFTDKIKEKDSLWFVKFCVPWCKHCKQAQSIWEELGKDVDLEDGVEIAEVDCTTSKATCTSVGIRSYPTLKLFYDGEDHKTYKGKRELTGLKSFVIEAAQNLTNAIHEEL